MDCASVLLEPLLSFLRNAAGEGLSFCWNLLTQGLSNHLYLGRNADELAQETSELLEERDDLLAQLAAQEGPRLKRTHQVNGWLARLDALRAEVAEFESAFERRTTCLEGCSLASLHANYRLGGAAADRLRRVRALKEQKRSLAEVVGPAPPEPVEAVPTSAAPIVGGEETLSEIRRHLGADGARIIGIYGMGGVGKTTLIAEINNELLATPGSGFDMAIWVTVSRDLNVPRIQKQIGDRFGLPLSAEFSTSDRAERVREQAKMLFDRLSGEVKLLLFLDDVWEKLDLAEIGIPYPTGRNHCRIVFTTRSREVCAGMDAKVQLQVGCLNSEDSWRLFCEKLGAEVDIRSRHLGPLAELVVAKCGGLPLALITVARAMAHATTAGEWEEAIEVLKDSPEKLSGMEEEVLSILKFSFDRLENETLRQCLLYCCLFPEDHKIQVEELVEYWIGEGFLDDNRYVPYQHRQSSYHNKGLVNIRKLKEACLLENCGDRNFEGEVVSFEEDRYVKMHDTVREMCVWLTTGGHVDGSNTFLVHAGRGSTEAPSAHFWRDCKRISLMHNDIAALLPNEIPTCPALLTFLINENCRLQSVPPTGFSSMPALCVLDVSYTNLKDVPVEIGLLLQLRFLNLSGTGIRALPNELGNLAKLRQLILRDTTGLERIPRGAVTRLTNLQTLSLISSSYKWCWPSEQTQLGSDDHHGRDDGEAQLSLQDLVDLKRLYDLRLDVATSSCLEGFLGSRRLLRSTRFLTVMVPDFGSARDLSKAFRSMHGMRRLEVDRCFGLKGDLTICGDGRLQKLEYLRLRDLPLETSVVAGMLNNCLLPCLRKLVLGGCHSLRDLTWVARQLPSLEELHFLWNDQIEELARGEAGYEADDRTRSFPSLKMMHLVGLPRLRVISIHPLLFPALEQLLVVKCPELRKLPLEHRSAKKIREIRGEREWWDALEWDSADDTTRSTFLYHFRPW